MLSYASVQWDKDTLILIHNLVQSKMVHPCYLSRSPATCTVCSLHAAVSIQAGHKPHASYNYDNQLFMLLLT